MNKLVSIKYRVDAFIDEEDFAGENYDEKDFKVDEYEDFLEDKDPEFEGDYFDWKEKQKEFEEVRKNLVDHRIKDMVVEENAQFYTYTFGKKVVRYERELSQRENEFMIIGFHSGILSHYFTNELGTPQLEETGYHTPLDYAKWTVHYCINVFKEETKIILGYECYKMIIEQEYTNEKEDWQNINIYELYVTDELKLPARLVIPLKQAVTEVCALEIKAINLKYRNSYEIYRAAEILINVDKGKLELPEIFKGMR